MDRPIHFPIEEAITASRKVTLGTFRSHLEQRGGTIAGTYDVYINKNDSDPYFIIRIREGQRQDFVHPSNFYTAEIFNDRMTLDHNNQLWIHSPCMIDVEALTFLRAIWMQRIANHRMTEEAIREYGRLPTEPHQFSYIDLLNNVDQMNYFFGERTPVGGSEHLTAEMSALTMSERTRGGYRSRKIRAGARSHKKRRNAAMSRKARSPLSSSSRYCRRIRRRRRRRRA